MDKAQIDMTVRVAGAIAFKNYVKRNWKVVSSFDQVLLFYKSMFKNYLLNCYTGRRWSK